MANTIRLKRGTVEPTAGSLVTGEVAINTTNGNAYTLTDAGDVVQIGASAVSLTATVRNETGATLTKGQVVYLNGASGNKALAVLAQANSEATSSGTYGLVQTDIANNNNGTIVIAGFINKLNTQGYTDGDKVYLSPTTAGGWTTTKPSAPNHMVFLGTITRAHQTLGTIELRIANGFEIEELHNVSITSVTNGQVLTYDSATGLWKNATPASGGGTWGSITGTLSSQTDLNNALAAKAPLASPTFTGTPAAPTATAGTNTTQVATTAFVTTAVSTKANLASPTFTGTPAAPTPATATNSTQIATTAYVKTNLTSYATLAGNPAFTGYPTAGTAATSNESTTLATTAFVKANNRNPASALGGGLTSYGALDENACYVTAGNGDHAINLYQAGYLNSAGSIIMFYQNDDSQIYFDSSTTTAPNQDRYYAAFRGATIFAIKTGSPSYWAIYGDLIATQYQAYGTVITPAAVDSTNTVSSGIYDYNSNMIQAYTYHQEIANGWGGTTTQNVTAPYGTVMSGTYPYSSADTYQLTADGAGGYVQTFVSSTGPDPYGTKYGTPYWDSSFGALYQAIADGMGGTAYVTWDGNAPYPTYGTQISTTTYNNSGSKTDYSGQSWSVVYDETLFANGSGGSYDSWTISSGYYYPNGWAFDAPHVDMTLYNYITYFYNSSYGNEYPWAYGYNGSTGSGGTGWFNYGTPSYGTQMSNYFTDQYSNYGYIAADGSGGFYFQV